jgi:Bacterial membrane protein YfhO
MRGRRRDRDQRERFVTNAPTLSRAGVRLELALAVVFLTLWILPPFWGIATLRTVNVQDDIFASDLWNDRLPARAFVGASVRRGESPAWMPGIYTGFPSLAQIEVGTLYPSNLLLFGLLPPYAAIAWAQILPLAIAGIGMFLLAAELGMPIEARLLAAGAFSLSGFLVAHLRQLNMVDASAWIPFILLAVERIATRRAGRALLWLSVVWALELLAGHPQIAYFTGLVLAVYFPVRWWQTRPDARWSSWAGLAAALALGTLIAAAQIIPAIELSGLTYREGGLRFEEAARYAVSPLNFWTFFVPGLFGDARDDSFRLSGLYWEQYGYVGLLPAVLAVVALVVKRRNKHVLLIAAITAASYALVLGKNTPLFGWLFAGVPGMTYFRFPTRFLLFVEIGICLLAGFGLAACLEGLAGLRRSLLAAALIAITAVDLWTHQMRQVPQIEWRRWLAPIDTVRILSEARAAVPEPWRYYALDASLVHAQMYHAAHGWSGDLTPYLQLRALLQPSFNLLFGFEAPDGYANLVPRAYEAIWGSEKQEGIRSSRHLETGDLEPALAKMLRLFNVRYVLSIVPLRSAALRAIARSDEGVEVYEVRDPLPRAFVVGTAVYAASETEALRFLTASEFDAANQAAVGVPDLRLPEDARSSTNVRVVDRRNTLLELHASLASPGLLVVSEGYYPGWQAEVDGVAAPIVPTNGMMRGVVLHAGEHRIVFRFRSRAIAAGFLLSGLAIVLAFVARRHLVITRGTS